MKVLFVSNDPSIFDPQSAARLRMNAYAHAIGELHIVSPASRDARNVDEAPLHLHPVHPGRFLRMRRLTKAARKIVREAGIEVVSAQDPFELGKAAKNAVRGTHAKLHIQVHTDFLSPWFARESLKNRIRVYIADGVLPHANGIRVVSKRVQDSLQKRYGTRIVDATVIPIAVDAQTSFATPLPEHSFAFSLVTVGRLEKEKRIRDILKAFHLVLKKRPKESIGLFVIGDGRERARLERLVRWYGLHLHVIFLGVRSDARALMKSAQVFVQASAYEGYGRTLLEAALAGIPIITTDVGIAGDVLNNREEALITPVENPVALAEVIMQLMDDTQLRLKLPLRAEAAARAHMAAAGDTVTRIAEDLAHTLSRAPVHG